MKIAKPLLLILLIASAALFLTFRVRTRPTRSVEFPTPMITESVTTPGTSTAPTMGFTSTVSNGSRVCTIIVGASDGEVITAADLMLPKMCVMPFDGKVTQVQLAVDHGHVMLTPGHGNKLTLVERLHSNGCAGDCEGAQGPIENPDVKACEFIGIMQGQVSWSDAEHPPSQVRIAIVLEPKLQARTHDCEKERRLVTE